jgi:hypothetical protein
MTDKKRADIRKKLCKPFCHYYKPGKSHALACMGFIVAERLMKKVGEISFQTAGRALAAETQEMLIRNMCTACPFYADDCDFVLRKKGAPPCGGFLVLGNLFEIRKVTVDKIIDNTKDVR